MPPQSLQIWIGGFREPASKRKPARLAVWRWCCQMLHMLSSMHLVEHRVCGFSTAAKLWLRVTPHVRRTEQKRHVTELGWSCQRIPPETGPFGKSCRFEHLALDYDEEDIGSLSEGEAAPSAPLDSFGTVLDDFLANAETGLPVEASEVLPAFLSSFVQMVIARA